jgi:outer membrane protein, multidrug efflux system
MNTMHRFSPLTHISPRLVLSLGACVLLSACASTAPLQGPLPISTVPAAWTGTAPSSPPAQAPTALGAWWQRFNDPLMTGLVTQALQANTSVQSAQAALLQARALRDVQQAGLGPRLGASGSAQRSDAPNSGATNHFTARFDASWEPAVFSGQRGALEASEAEAQVSALNLGQVQVSLAAEVAAAYIELRGLQARLGTARSSLDAQAQTLQITRWRVQAGLASSLDLAQAEAASEQTAAQIPTLQTGITQALNSLAVLTGQAPGALHEQLTKPAEVPQAPDTLALAFPAETLRQRPDVHIAEWRIRAAQARLSQAQAAHLPSFRLSGTLGLSALTLGSLSSSAALANTLLASVSLPVFDGGAARAQVRAQAAALEQANVAYRAAVLAALKDVEDALVALQGNRERVARLQAATQAAANAELLARQRYSSGLVDFRAVLDTQRTLLNTQDSLASARASLSADHVRLYKALGGGWTPADATTLLREPAARDGASS